MQRPEQARTGHHAVVDRVEGDEVLAAQVLGELELGGEAAWRADQALAVVKVEAFAEFGIVRGRLPAARVVDQELSQVPQRGRLRMPQPSAAQGATRLE